MKVRIIKRLLTEDKNKHVPIEIQNTRISIAMKIDSMLQRPVINVGQEQLIYNKETGKEVYKYYYCSKQGNYISLV